MHPVRRWLAFLICLFLLSCNSNTKEDTQPPLKDDADSTGMNAGQETFGNPYATVDVSPMDMSYYPVDYPKLKMANSAAAAEPVVRVIYSRPHLQGRQLFHDVLQFGEAWRLGANESTEIEFFREVTIGNKQVKPGKYILYCILGEKTWSLILNSNLNSWGLKQEPRMDVLRVDVPVTHGNPPLEFFTMVFEKSDTGANLVIGWDDVVVKMPIAFS